MRPCATCPWLRSAPLGYWHPAHLVAIAYAMSTDMPTGSMGCHEWNGTHPGRAPKDSPVCGGWARVARNTPGVRLRVVFGAVPEAETHDTDGLDLYPDVESMLRWNGIDVDRLPPLRAPGGGDVWIAWAQEHAQLRESIVADPERARAFVIPGSPMDYGVSDGKPNIPPRKLAAWLRGCAKWAQARAERA